ncbi:hypothetical protein KAT84_00930 [Candidatus Bipolaricaulota bacterium]|nr:hypothetical protein [Candidatus Bipolaricaulota bacterium]
MLDPRSQCDYVKRPVEVEETPSFPDVVRELEWLQALKHVEITEQYSNVICARLTPFGRALIEQSDQDQPAKRREIGFETDEE